MNFSSIALTTCFPACPTDNVLTYFATDGSDNIFEQDYLQLFIQYTRGVITPDRDQEKRLLNNFIEKTNYISFFNAAEELEWVKIISKKVKSLIEKQLDIQMTFPFVMNLLLRLQNNISDKTYNYLSDLLLALIPIPEENDPLREIIEAIIRDQISPEQLWNVIDIFGIVHNHLNDNNEKIQYFLKISNDQTVLELNVKRGESIYYLVHWSQPNNALKSFSNWVAKIKNFFINFNIFENLFPKSFFENEPILKSCIERTDIDFEILNLIGETFIKNNIPFIKKLGSWLILYSGSFLPNTINNALLENLHQFRDLIRDSKPDQYLKSAPPPISENILLDPEESETQIVIRISDLIAKGELISALVLIRRENIDLKIYNQQNIDLLIQFISKLYSHTREKHILKQLFMDYAFMNFFEKFPQFGLNTLLFFLRSAAGPHSLQDEHLLVAALEATLNYAFLLNHPIKKLYPILNLFFVVLKKITNCPKLLCILLIQHCESIFNFCKQYNNPLQVLDLANLLRGFKIEMKFTQKSLQMYEWAIEQCSNSENNNKIILEGHIQKVFNSFILNNHGNPTDQFSFCFAQINRLILIDEQAADFWILCCIAMLTNDFKSLQHCFLISSNAAIDSGNLFPIKIWTQISLKNGIQTQEKIDIFLELIKNKNFVININSESNLIILEAALFEIAWLNDKYIIENKVTQYTPLQEELCNLLKMIFHNTQNLENIQKDFSKACKIWNFLQNKIYLSPEVTTSTFKFYIEALEKQSEIIEWQDELFQKVLSFNKNLTSNTKSLEWMHASKEICVYYCSSLINRLANFYNDPSNLNKLEDLSNYIPRVLDISGKLYLDYHLINRRIQLDIFFENILCIFRNTSYDQILVCGFYDIIFEVLEKCEWLESIRKIYLLKLFSVIKTRFILTYRFLIELKYSRYRFTDEEYISMHSSFFELCYQRMKRREDINDIISHIMVIFRLLENSPELLEKIFLYFNEFFKKLDYFVKMVEKLLVDKNLIKSTK